MKNIRYTKEEMIEYEMNKIDNGEISIEDFFRNAINIQNRTYTMGYAEEKMEIACECLIKHAFCNHAMCHSCALQAAHERAIKEIKNCARSKEGVIIRDNRPKFTTQEYEAIKTICDYILDLDVPFTGSDIVESVRNKTRNYILGDRK